MNGINDNFTVTVTPQIYISDLEYYDKEINEYVPRYGSMIDYNWFTRIKFEQSIEQSIEQNYLANVASSTTGATSFTKLIIDFTISDTKYEIHDCFVDDFLGLMQRLSLDKKITYICNSSECMIEYDENQEPLKHTVYIDNNKIMTILGRNDKNILIDGSYTDINEIINNIKNIYTKPNHGPLTETIENISKEFNLTSGKFKCESIKYLNLV